MDPVALSHPLVHGIRHVEQSDSEIGRALHIGRKTATRTPESPSTATTLGFSGRVPNWGVRVSWVTGAEW